MSLAIATELLQCKKELEETRAELNAIKAGQIDAIFSSIEDEDALYTRRGVDNTYRILVESMHDGAIIISETNHITFANKSIAKLLNVHLEKLIGSLLFDWIADNSQVIHKAIAESPFFKDSEVINLKSIDGSTIPVLFSMRRLTGYRNNNYYGIIITDQSIVKTEEVSAVFKKNLILKNVIENIPVAIFLKRASDLKFIEINSNCEKLFNRLRSDIIDHSAYDLYPKEKADMINKIDHSVLLQNQKVNVPEELVITPNGVRTFRTQKIAIRDTGNNPIYILGVSEDITEDKLSNELLKNAVIDADAANKAKSIFLTSMSHEIRTPLNAIIGLTDLLLEFSHDKEQKRMLNIVHAAGENLLFLINNILDLSRIEFGKMNLEKVEFLISEQIEYAVSIMDFKAREKNIKINYIIAPGVSNFVLGDPTRLRQIILNLLSNSIKFSEHGAINISVKHYQKINQFQNVDKSLNLIQFEVSDQGIGIEATKINDLFKNFIQLDNTITRRFGGSGLGLAISKKLIELMHGKIWVTSELGKGSTFTFTVNLEELEDASHEFTTQVHNEKILECPNTKDSPPDPTIIKPLHILLAEDSVDNRILVEFYLKGLPHKLIQVKDGQEAVNQFKKEKFDIVLMDIQMPIMDGYTATREIRKWESEKKLTQTPILALTAHAFEEDIIASKNAGCTLHVSKPIKKTKLLQLLKFYT